MVRFYLYFLLFFFDEFHFLQKERPKVDDLVKQVIASGLGSISTILTLNPLNVLKVRLQNSHASMNKVSLSPIARGILANQGVRGFWSGTAVALTMSIPNTVLFMTAYEKFKILLRENLASSRVDGQDRWWVPALAGGFARVFSVSVISPLELARTIKASGNSGNTLQIMKEVVQSEGIRGLYKGWVPTLWRDCPFSAIYWFNVEMFRPIYYNLLLSASTYGKDGEVPASPSNNTWRTSASVFLAGSTGSLIAAVITHPFDVIKTQKQLTTTASTDATLSLGSVGSIVHIVKQEGFYGVFRGLSMRLLTVIPGSAILVTVYEAVKAIDF